MSLSILYKYVVLAGAVSLLFVRRIEVNSGVRSSTGLCWALSPLVVDMLKSLNRRSSPYVARLRLPRIEHIYFLSFYFAKDYLNFRIESSYNEKAMQSYFWSTGYGSDWYERLKDSEVTTLTRGT